MASKLVWLSAATLGALAVPLSFEEIHDSATSDKHTAAHNVAAAAVPNKCVSKHASVTDSYCATVKCAPQYSEFCVWMHSKEADAILNSRRSDAKAGFGTKAFVAAVNKAAAKTGPNRKVPKVNPNGKIVNALDKQDADVHDAVLKKGAGKCFAPITWYPHRDCGNPSAAVCSRGWGVYESKADCCEKGAAFSQGCHNFQEPLRFKNKVIGEVLSADPRVQKGEAEWLREMSFELQQREALLKYGKKAVAGLHLPSGVAGAHGHHAVAPGVVVPQPVVGAHGSVSYVYKQKTPMVEVESHPPLYPKVEGESRPPYDIHGHTQAETGVFLTKHTPSEIPKIFSHNDWNHIFPNANFHAEPAIYTYENFINATGYFPLFAAVGHVDERKRELAAFLAHVSQETSGWWSGQEYVWGLTYNREEACGESKDGCNLYAACSKSKKDQRFPCTHGKGYYGRGPMMLAWNYNYGELSQYLFGDNRLLLDPDSVANDGVIAFMSALWFWMEPHGGFGKPSSHDAINGLWRPSPQDKAAGRAPGFGLTLNIVDGKKQCLVDPVPQEAQHRIGYYLRACSLLRISPGDHVNCKAQIPFVTTFDHPLLSPSTGKIATSHSSVHHNSVHHTSATLKSVNATHHAGHSASHMTMGDRSYHPHHTVPLAGHVAHVHQPKGIVTAPVSPMDKYKFLQTGRKCDEDKRIFVECGDCGPGLTDFDACRSMCDANLGCHFFNYFNNKACRIYTDCTSTLINTRSVIYQKQLLGVAENPSATASTWPFVPHGKKWVDETEASKVVKTQGSGLVHLGLAELDDMDDDDFS